MRHGRRGRRWTVWGAAGLAIGTSLTLHASTATASDDDVDERERERKPSILDHRADRDDQRRRPPAATERSYLLGPAGRRDGQVETVYDDMVSLQEENQGVNAGGVNFELGARYLTDYVFRGIDRGEQIATFPGDEGPGEPVTGNEDAPALQLEFALEFDLGRVPHPIGGVFVNVYDDDPVTRFQEIRPWVGLEWSIRPLILSGGHTTYIFPEREDSNTNEVWARIELDDSMIFNRDEPVLSPYVMAAYDYDLYDGLYVEAGVSHRFPIEGTGIVLTAVADVAYVADNVQFFKGFAGDIEAIDEDAEDFEDTGFQHYQVGLVGTYALNTLLNIPRRYGDFRLEGYLYYTGRIDEDLAADDQLWGGVGIGFRY